MRIFSLLIIVFFITSCNKPKKQIVKDFLVTSIEDRTIVSAKSNFNDTLFYEFRYTDSTTYGYELLSKKQNEELLKFVTGFEEEFTTSKFELLPGNEIFAVRSDEIIFYKYNFSRPKSNFGKINMFFKYSGNNLVKVNEIKDFWNISDVSAPKNPPKKIEIKTENNSR